MAQHSRGQAWRLRLSAIASWRSSPHRMHSRLAVRRDAFSTVTAAAVAAAPAPRTLLVNGRSYRMPAPSSHTVALLLDGSSMDYLHAASAQHLMPCFNALLARSITPAASRLPLSSSPASTRKFTPYFTTATADSARQAELGLVSGVMPAFTNPNNVSVVTGVTARIHGISGNYYYDAQTGREVMMTDPELIRCQSILAAACRQGGADVTIITVKDKLTRLLSKGLDDAAAVDEKQDDGSTRRGRVRCLSIENLSAASLPAVDLSRVVRNIYDPLCSISALQLGVDLLRSDIAAAAASPSPSPPHLYYFSTTDYVQHHSPPGHSMSLAFYAALDSILQQLHALHVPFAFTADHGMSAKARADLSPRAVYIDDVLTAFSSSSHSPLAAWRTVLPITDPHTVHHGSLGGYATVYSSSASDSQRIMSCLRQQRGVYTVMSGDEAADALELPRDRIGDVVVVSDRDWVLGSSADRHRDGIALLQKHDTGGAGEQAVGLRSHGGFDDLQVPLFVNRRIRDPVMRKRLMQGKMRNFDLFDVLLNGIREDTQ